VVSGPRGWVAYVIQHRRPGRETWSRGDLQTTLVDVATGDENAAEIAERYQLVDAPVVRDGCSIRVRVWPYTGDVPWDLDPEQEPPCGSWEHSPARPYLVDDTGPHEQCDHDWNHVDGRCQRPRCFAIDQTKMWRPPLWGVPLPPPPELLIVDDPPARGWSDLTAGERQKITDWYWQHRAGRAAE
jgi:hypothetical protein